MSRPAVASAALAATAAAVAGYLTWEHAHGAAPVCLAGGGGCQTVASSPYARIAGVPVAALGLTGALTLLALALVPALWARTAAGAIAIGGFLFSAYLTAMEIFVIDAICQWCVASACLWTAMCVLECWRWRTALLEAAPDS